MHRTNPIKRARSIIISAFIVLSLVGVGYDAQPALKNQADEIDTALKSVEKRITGGDHLDFRQTDIQSALNKLQKLSVDLSKASIHADANHSASEMATITNVGAQYMSELFSFYVIYARAAHSLSANARDYNFDTLAAYTLKLKLSTALDLLKLKPFNSRHLTADVMEFFINSQDKQMAEFFALTSPKDELTYAKLIQFSALRENFTNMWAIQRLTATEIPTQPVKSCAPELLSFRSPPSGLLKDSEDYLELTASDRYKSLTSLVTGAYQKTLSLSFLSQAAYYEVFSKVLSSTNEFKNYTSGATPQDVSTFLNKASALVSTFEQSDWADKSKNSEKLLGGSTLMNDQLSASAIARRMAEVVFERRETAAIAQISSIAAENIKIKDIESIQKKSKDLIDSTYRTQWLSQAEQELASSIASLDQSSLKTQETAARSKEKVEDTLALASVLMPAVHDYDLINNAVGVPVENEQDLKKAQAIGMSVYLRPEFKLEISDPETLKAHLLKQIQNKSSLWANLQKNSSAMLLLNSFFVGVADDFKKKVDATKITNSDQAAKILLAVAQADASNILQKSAPASKKSGLLKLVAQTLDFSSVNALVLSGGAMGAIISAQSAEEAPQKLLQSAFSTINLLGAKIPTDLSPATSQQQDLASIVIAQGYEYNPLLAVKTPGGTILERIYREALEDNANQQLDYAAGGLIVLEGIQAAAANIQGKLEDFCQAEVGNPARDLRFRRLFRASSHLRDVLIRASAARDALADNSSFSQYIGLLPANGGSSADLAKLDASLTKKTQTTSEKILKRFISPLFMVLSAAMVLVMIISVCNPLTTIPALAAIMAIANFGMIGLSAISSYFEVSSTFFEQPAQVRYQEALASAQVSADSHFEQWDELKAKGLISSVSTRASADQAKQALVSSQLMAIPQLGMNAWVGYGGLKQVASNIGLTGMLKYQELAGAEMPGWAEKAAPPEAKTFSENVREQGPTQAFKQKASQVAGQIKAAMGLSPTIGAYTGEEALGALKIALARVLPENSKELLPEVELYRDFLKARLKVTEEVSALNYLGDGTTINVPEQIIDDGIPDFVKTNSNLQAYEDTGARTADGAGQILSSTGKPLDHIHKFWTETPQMEGGLSWKEMMENPQLLKWRLIPKSALKAARAGPTAFATWIKQYGSVVKLTNMLRGELIAQKLEGFEALVTKLQGLNSQGMNTTEVLRNLNPHDMALLQEAARGPQFLAYGYWSAKSAERTMSNLPLRQSTDVFDSYNSMIQSLKPDEWAPSANTAQAYSSDQSDVRNFYRFTRNLDSEPGAQNSQNQDTSQQKVITLEAGIERTLFRKINP